MRVEDVPFHDGYAPQLLPLALTTLGLGWRALRRGGRSPLVAAAAALGAAVLADDVSNGRRAYRRLIQKPDTTTNVIAEAGDADAPLTLVVLAHHDAAPTGVIFDPGPQAKLAEKFPGVVAATDTSLPLWWPVVGAPLLVAAGAATGRTGLLKAGLVGNALTAALALDIARGEVVPGANDNLSACASLVALAEDPPAGIRVLLVSCGAEEVLQGGIHAFGERYFPQLPRDTTFVLNLDTVGSPELIMLEGEGPFVMEDYCDPGFRDLVARAAERVSGPLRRGCRARTSTDSVVPSRAGYPTATLCSWIPETKALANYHWPTDTPENLDFSTVERAVKVAKAVAEDLARG